MLKRIFLLICMISLMHITNAQLLIKPFVGAGYGLENRFGFRGFSFEADGELYILPHIQGVLTAQYFTSSQVPKWSEVENKDVYFRQLTASVKAQYSTREDGMGLILNAGLGIRSGNTYHFETGDLHEGTFSNQTFLAERIRGTGVLLGLGYTFAISSQIAARIELDHFAFTGINDMQTLNLKIGF